jgi:hypothetical protein
MIPEAPRSATPSSSHDHPKKAEIIPIDQANNFAKEAIRPVSSLALLSFIRRGNLLGAMIIVAAPALAISTPILCSSFELPVTFGDSDGGGGDGNVVVGFSIAGGVLTNGKGFVGADIVVDWTQVASRGPACAV